MSMQTRTNIKGEIDPAHTKDVDLKIIRYRARICAAETIAELGEDAPRTWDEPMRDRDIDEAGQYVGRPLDEYEMNSFDEEFRRHYADIMSSP